MAEQTTNTGTQNIEQPTGGQQTQQPTTNYDEVFSKLDEILEKRANGFAKSVLKENGVDESEIADIVKAYREQKQNQATNQATALSEAQNQIAALTKQLNDREIDDAFSAAALELGVDTKQLPYVTRLASKDGILGADNKPDAEKVKEAINKVLEDVPALKASANANKGFVQVGAKTGDGAESGEDANKKLREYFGLK
jgi:transposase-like protein